jgi:lipocalin
MVEVEENYFYAFVGTPSRRNCWIRSKTPTASRLLIERPRTKCFDVSRLQHAEHTCADYQHLTMNDPLG